MRYAAAAMALAVGAGLTPSAFAQIVPGAATAEPAVPPAAGSATVGAAPEAPAAPEVPAAPDVAPAPEASAPPAAAAAYPSHAPGDPFEHINRGIFSFNTALDKHFMEPVAKGYRAITPRFFRTGVENFLHNIQSPVIFANDVLQASPKRAGVTAGRFVVNSTVGVGGLFDVAQHMGMESHDEDFGQTLGHWGVGGGPFLMLPLLGPSNVRDAIGKGVDTFLDPLTYARFEGDDTVRISRFALDTLSQRTDAIDAIEDMRATSIDPYATTRSVYEQSRVTAINNGQDGAEDSPESNGTLSQ